jgi:hypothetical protein
MTKKENKTGESENSEEPKPEKKISNFPAKGPRKRPAKILPAHREIFKNYKENNFRHLGKAVRKTGVYSESVASRTHNITKSKSWKALMSEYMPEEYLAQKHAEILDKRSYRKVTDEVGNVTEVDDGPDTAAVTKGLDMAYKLTGAYKEKEAPKASTVMYNLIYKPEVREQMKVFEDGLKNTLIHEVARKNQKEAEIEAENEANREGGEDSEPKEGAGSA